MSEVMTALLLEVLAFGCFATSMMESDVSCRARHLTSGIMLLLTGILVWTAALMRGIH